MGEEVKLPSLLVINTYAGSLLLGARMAGAEVTASMEDCGFGQGQARANFPDVRHVEKTSDWPDADLSGHVVAAHPPCAAFSIQAKGSVAKGHGKFGLESDHFDETRSVLNYAMSHRALAVTAESVQGALDGAREEHDKLAAAHGYRVFRILQNAATFGVPQWRPRFWVVFAREFDRFATWHVPKCVPLSAVLDDVDPGEPDAEIARTFKAQIKALRDAKFDVKKLLSEPGMLARNIQKHYRPNTSLNEIAGKFCTAARGKKSGGSVKIGHRWVSATPRVLDPNGTTPVVMHDSWFIYRSQPVTPNEYRAVMGFPRDYTLDHAYRLWLSKGVVPAVAAWVIDVMRRNVAGDVPEDATWTEAGGTVDYQVSKGTWRRLAAGEDTAVPAPVVIQTGSSKEKRPEVLVINTYAGSLLLGARMAGAEVTASLEDCGYGQERARANFPDVEHVARWQEWPERDLSGHLVIAHPPCAAFSKQAKGSAKSFGLASKHFDETRRVLEYAMAHRCSALAVESVQPALEGARSEHDAIAERHGYHVFRILLNSATFGVPQWRPRFWCVFTRAERFAVWHRPRCVKLSDVLDVAEPGPPDARTERYLAAQEWHLKQTGAWTPELLSTPGRLLYTLRKVLGDDDLHALAKRYCLVETAGCAKFDDAGDPVFAKGSAYWSGGLTVLDPDACAPTVMGCSFWAYRGRPVTPAEFRAVMGFPRDYELDDDYRLWLSKGVVPQVAAWVVETMRQNVVRGDAGLSAPDFKLEPGETADLQITRTEWSRLANDEPTLAPTLAPAARPAAKKPVSGSAPKAPRVPARKTKHVVLAYVLTAPPETTEAQVEEAFCSKNNLVHPPLKEYLFREFSGKGKARRVVVDVVAQYEPPNSGGNVTDVDRIVARAAKKLGAEWRRA